MSSNFHFTSVDCPDAKHRQLVLTPIHTLRSYLDSCHRFTARQHSIRCARLFRLIPCPTPISPSWLQAADWRRLAEHAGFARMPTRAADAQSDTGSPHPIGMSPPPSHLVPLEQVPVTHRTRLPPRRHSAETPRTGFTAPAPTASPPRRHQRLIFCPGPSPRDMEAPTSCGSSESWWGSWCGTSDDQNKSCARRQIVPL